MMSSFRRLGLLSMAGIISALVLPTAAKADNVSFFNTGVDGVGTPIANGAVDSHWTINGGNALATSSNPNWVSNASSLASKWISTVSNGNTSVTGGTYIFSTTFDLTGYYPTTALLSGRWTSDNKTVAVRLNGNVTGITNADEVFGGWGNFAINTGFLAGVNTLEFEVFNGLNGVPINSPMGLRVEAKLTATRIPEPGTVGLLLTGVMGVLALRRRSSR